MILEEMPDNLIPNNVTLGNWIKRYDVFVWGTPIIESQHSLQFGKH